MKFDSPTNLLSSNRKPSLSHRQFHSTANETKRETVNLASRAQGLYTLFPVIAFSKAPSSEIVQSYAYI